MTHVSLRLEPNAGALSLATCLLALGENLWKRLLPKYLEAPGAPGGGDRPVRPGQDFLDGLYQHPQHPGGWIADRWGRRRVLVLFVALAGIGYALRRRKRNRPPNVEGPGKLLVPWAFSVVAGAGYAEDYICGEEPYRAPPRPFAVPEGAARGRIDPGQRQIHSHLFGQRVLEAEVRRELVRGVVLTVDDDDAVAQAAHEGEDREVAGRRRSRAHHSSGLQAPQHAPPPAMSGCGGARGGPRAQATRVAAGRGLPAARTLRRVPVTTADNADFERRQAQFAGQFLIDREGIVRWVNVERAREGIEGIDRLPSEEKVLAAVRCP